MNERHKALRKHNPAPHHDGSCTPHDFAFRFERLRNKHNQLLAQVEYLPRQHYYSLTMNGKSLAKRLVNYWESISVD